MYESTPPGPATFSERELASHLASALGGVKALELVRTTATKLKLPRGRMSLEQALSVLDAIADEPGLVGITARFVKSRLILG